MTNLDVPLILQRGVIGLGFLLALLAYWLLRREQSIGNPRNRILAGIKWFMGLSVVLCAMGLTADLVPRVLRDLTSASQTESGLRADLSRLQHTESLFRQTCQHIRTTNWLDKTNPLARASLLQYCVLG